MNERDDLATAPGAERVAAGARRLKGLLAPAPSGGRQRSSISARRTTSLVVLTAVAWLVFTYGGQGFLSAFNLVSLELTIAQTIVIGLAQATMIVIGRFNLAVGGTGVVVVACIGVLMNDTGWPLAVILAIAVVGGILASVVMALTELGTRLNSFVVTLAFLSIYRGGELLVTSATHYQIASPTLLQLGNGTVFSPYLSPELLVALGTALIVWLFYFRTSIGWKSRAVGANERAAAASAVAVKRVVVIGYAVSGLLCAVAAILQTAQLAEASPDTGNDWLLLSFIGPLLAGVALGGGTIYVAGVVIGSAFYGSIYSGLVVLGVSSYWLTLAQAVVLLGALVLGQAGVRLLRNAGIGPVRRA